MKNLESIIEGCCQFDEKCQQAIYTIYRGFACKIVFRYIYRYEKAMDVVTDGFVKAFLAFPGFEYRKQELEKQVMGWLKRIMINCAIDELRKTNMIPEIGEISEEVWQSGVKNDEADQQLLYKDLIKVIKALPTNYRLIFNLYVLDGYSHGEIAEKLKIPVATSRSSLTRARAILKSTLLKMEQIKVCTSQMMI